MKQNLSQNNLMQIPAVGKSISQDLINLGINSISDLNGKNPQNLYQQSNSLVGQMQDRYLLYVFRCAVYFAEIKAGERDPEKLKWWNWKDRK